MANSRQRSNYVLLRDTIRRRDKEKAQSLILSNVDVNNPRSKFNTPLHWSITQFKDVDIMTMLLDKGANIHARNQHNLKPFDIAIQNDKTEAALLLIKKGALFGEDLNKLLLQVIEKKNHIIVKNLLVHGIQYNISIDFNRLFNATISHGHAKILEYILPHCRFLKSSDKYIPRKLVVKSKYKDCVELLLKWNFTINPASNQDKYFIYGAVENGHLEIVLQLLKLGINVNLVNSVTGYNLLKIGCLNKHHKIVESLLKHNASINEMTPNSSFLSSYSGSDLESPACLHIAVLNSDAIMTRLLLKYGAKIVDDPTFFNITCIAVENNCEEIVRIFLGQGVNVSDINHQGKTLLHFCVNTKDNARDSRYNIAKLFLERGAVTHIQTPYNSLVFKAVENGHREIAQLFLDYNADIQYVNSYGDTLLHKAIEKDFDMKFITTLLLFNSPVNAVNNSMLTPLLVACKTKSNNQLEIIQLLLNHNANVNYAINIPTMPQNLVNLTFSCKFGFILNVNLNGNGQTPLHFICKYTSFITPSIIKLLLQHNADIEAVDARGWTPFFEACASNNYVAVKCLLDHNANANHKDFENLTPLYITAKYCKNNSEIIRLLLEHKVNVHCIDQQGNSIIHVIVENDKAEFIKSLACTQINLNSVNKDGDTPLHIAIAKQSIDMTEALIKYGANINVLDKKNRTPLQCAIRHLGILRNKLEEDRDNRDFYWGHRYYWDDSDENGYDTDCYESDTAKYKIIIEILQVQLVKLKAAKLKVNTQNLNIVYHSNNYNAFSNHDDVDYDINVQKIELLCEQEIGKMRMESIGVNNMTFYDLLKKSIYLLSRFVKNKKILQTLDLAIYDVKFPLYINIVRSRFRDAKLRYRLMNYAKNYFYSNVCSQLADDSVDTVFSFLNIKEIKMFIRATK